MPGNKSSRSGELEPPDTGLINTVIKAIEQLGAEGELAKGRKETESMQSIQTSLSYRNHEGPRLQVTNEMLNIRNRMAPPPSRKHADVGAFPSWPATKPQPDAKPVEVANSLDKLDAGAPGSDPGEAMTLGSIGKGKDLMPAPWKRVKLSSCHLDDIEKSAIKERGSSSDEFWDNDRFMLEDVEMDHNCTSDSGFGEVERNEILTESIKKKRNKETAVSSMWTYPSILSENDLYDAPICSNDNLEDDLKRRDETESLPRDDEAESTLHRPRRPVNEPHAVQSQNTPPLIESPPTKSLHDVPLLERPSPIFQPNEKNSAMPVRSVRQVGVAKIRVELLSLTRADCLSESEEDEPMDGDDSQNCHGNSSNNTGSDENQNNGCSAGSSGSHGDGLQAFSRSDQGRNGRGRDNSRKRRRTDHSVENMKGVARFACPYQAYEPLLNCLPPARRNETGGCDGIYRLKQHLRRVHMLSFRCQTCWRSFDTKARQVEHVRTPSSTGCRQKPRPESERFMDARHEADIDIMCRSSTSTEEDTWWKLFQLLIPGMDARDDDWLRANYYPYYIAGDLSLTIPRLNFTDTSFSQLGIQTNDGGSHVGISSRPGGLEQIPRALLTDIGTPFPTVSNQQSYMVSQTLSVPLFESTPNAPSQNWKGTSDTSNTIDPSETFQIDPGISGDQLLQSLLQIPQPHLDISGVSEPTTSQGSCHTTDPNLSTSDPSTSSLPAPSNDFSTPSITAQLRLNNERLRARYQRVESENAELRNANRAARSDIIQADAILEEILTNSASEHAGEYVAGIDTYNSLLRLSKLLETASERLRKAG